MLCCGARNLLYFSALNHIFHRDNIYDQLAPWEFLKTFSWELDYITLYQNPDHNLNKKSSVVVVVVVGGGGGGDFGPWFLPLSLNCSLATISKLLFG